MSGTRELSDAEVFGTAAAPQRELSDAEVFGAPAPSAGRSLGLGVRGVVAGAIDTVRNPAAALLNAPSAIVNDIAGRTVIPEPFSYDQGEQIADMLGLPREATPAERITGQAVRGGAGMIGPFAGARAIQGAAGAVQGARTPGQAVVGAFADSPGVDIAAGAVGGAVGGAVQEAGGGAVPAFAAELSGNVLTAAILAAVARRRAVNQPGARPEAIMPNASAVTPEEIDGVSAEVADAYRAQGFSDLEIRQALDAFRLAAAQRQRATPGAVDTQPGGVAAQDGQPVASSARMGQDFMERSASPRDPEMPRDPGDPVRQEPRQTFRTTDSDPNTEFPGASSGNRSEDGGPAPRGEAMGRTPFPVTGEELLPPGPPRDPSPGPSIEGGGPPASPEAQRAEQQLGRLVARGDPAPGTPAAQQAARLRETLARLEAPETGARPTNNGPRGEAAPSSQDGRALPPAPARAALPAPEARGPAIRLRGPEADTPAIPMRGPEAPAAPRVARQERIGEGDDAVTINPNANTMRRLAESARYGNLRVVFLGDDFAVVDASRAVHDEVGARISRAAHPSWRNRHSAWASDRAFIQRVDGRLVVADESGRPLRSAIHIPPLLQRVLDQANMPPAAPRRGRGDRPRANSVDISVDRTDTPAATTSRSNAVDSTPSRAPVRSSDRPAPVAPAQQGRAARDEAVRAVREAADAADSRLSAAADAEAASWARAKPAERRLLRSAFMQGAADENAGNAVPPVRGASASDRFGSDLRMSEARYAGEAWRRLRQYDMRNTESDAQATRIARAYEAGTRFADENPDAVGRSFSVTTRTARGRETRYTFRDARNARETADRLEKMPATTFYANPLGDPAAWKRFVADPIVGTARFLRGKLMTSVSDLGRSPGPAAFWRLHVDSARATLMHFRDRYAKVPGVRELVENLGATDPGSGTVSRAGYQETADAKVRQMGNRVANMLREIGDDSAALGRVRDILTGQTVRGATAAEKTAASRLRGLLDEHHAWLSKRLGSAEREMGYVRGRYFPRRFDSQAIQADLDGFTADASALYRRMGLDADTAKLAAEEWANRVMGVGAGASRYADTPSGAFTKGRTLPPDADTAMRKWLVTDPREALAGYFESSTRHAEFVARFGPNGQKLDEAMAGMRKAGATPTELEIVRRAFASATGTSAGLGNPTTGVLSWAQMWGMRQLLTRALFSSAMEPISVGIRSGDLRDSFTALGDTWKRFLTPDRWQGDKARMETERAEMLGVLGDSTREMLMAARVEAQNVTVQHARKINQMLDITGQNRLFAASRVAASRIAEHAIVKLVRGEQDALAARALAEVGMDADTAKTVRAWLNKHDGRPPIAEMVGDTPAANAYRTAVNRFVNESVINPMAIDRPTGAGERHPMAQLAYGIMSFQYAFTRNVLFRTFKQGGAAVAGSGMSLQERATLLIPTAGLMMLAAAQFGQSKVRDAIFNRQAKQERPPFVDTVLALDRAGLFGNLSPLVNLVTSARYERDASGAMVGPYVGNMLRQAGDIALGPIPQGIGGPNSPNTNNAEWAAVRAGWSLIVAPAAVGALAAAPMPSWLKPAAGAAAMYVGSSDASRSVATAAVGERDVQARTQRAGARPQQEAR